MPCRQLGEVYRTSCMLCRQSGGVYRTSPVVYHTLPGLYLNSYLRKKSWEKLARGIGGVNIWSEEMNADFLIFELKSGLTNRHK